MTNVVVAGSNNDNSFAVIDVSSPVQGPRGVHRAEITATGNACGGVFERYWSGSVYVGSRKQPRG